jgi:hypothetical protein
MGYYSHGHFVDSDWMSYTAAKPVSDENRFDALLGNTGFKGVLTVQGEAGYSVWHGHIYGTAYTNNCYVQEVAFYCQYDSIKCVGLIENLKLLDSYYLGTRSDHRDYDFLALLKELVKIVN